MNLPRLRGSLTTWSLAALAAGLLLGTLDKATGAPALAALAAVLGPLGSLWLSALQMTVLPLVLALVMAAMVGTGETAAVGRLTARAFLVFAAMLAGAMAFTLLVAPPLIESLRVSPETAATLREAGRVSAAGRAADISDAGSLGEWVAGFLPNNLFAAAIDGALLPLLLFAAILGLATARLPAVQREPLARAIEGLAAAMLIVIRWILWPLPIAVFALVFLFTREVGAAMIGLLGAYIAIMSGVSILATLLLYPASILFGRVSLRSFARAVAPGQLVGLSTRSSIASLPALVTGGREHLRLPPRTIGLVLPLSVSVFKLSPMISAPLNLFFLAHVFGIPLSAGTIVVFLLTIFLISFVTPGIPGGGPVATLPAYLAAGLPIEGVVILDPLDVIPDLFKTVLNVTGYMTAATIISRSGRAAQDVAPEEEPAAA